MYWIGIVVFAQFLNAIVAMVDRYIVASRTIPNPFTYAFFVSLLSALAIFVFLFSWLPPVPFIQFSIPALSNVGLPSSVIAGVSIIAGVALFGALYALFSAFKYASASDVIPVSGAASAVGALLLSRSLLGSMLTSSFFVGFLLLVTGTVLISHFRFGWRTGIISVTAGILFAIHFVSLKFLFGITHFDDAFFWSRAGIALVAFAMLFVPKLRDTLIKHCKKASHGRGGVLIFGNKMLAGIASILLLKAIELGSVSIVQALGGLQFAFLLLFGAVFGPLLPEECGEHARERHWIYKTVAIIIIMAGFFVLFL